MEVFRPLQGFGCITFETETGFSNLFNDGGLFSQTDATIQLPHEFAVPGAPARPGRMTIKPDHTVNEEVNRSKT
jgi:hypothetical protein